MTRYFSLALATAFLCGCGNPFTGLKARRANAGPEDPAAPPLRDHTFNSQGVKIHYVTQGSGEPVVLIHGLYSSAFINWQLTGVVSELARDHQVIALDLPGHGLSDKPTVKEAYGVQMVDDIVLQLDHLKIQKAHIVGYSLGGMITMKFLTRFPERALSGTLGGMGWFREGSGEQFLMQKLPAGSLGPPPAFFESVGNLAVTEDDVKKITVPVKVLVGDRDFAKQTYVAPLQTIRNDWEVVEIRDADHLSCIAAPQFRQEIGRWVRMNSRQ
jgi:pimeloyl-ACP methyl ester carboxylesterase